MEELTAQTATAKTAAAGTGGQTISRLRKGYAKQETAALKAARVAGCSPSQSETGHINVIVGFMVDDWPWNPSFKKPGGPPGQVSQDQSITQ